MAGQGLERREVLRMLALAAAASGHPGFHRWSFACGHGGGAARDRLQVKPARYVPRFFSAEEYAVVERLADLVIPSDGTPGASEAGVAEFVDFMVDHDPGVQYRFRYGLVWLDARARKANGRSFRELPRADQEEILGGLAYRDRHRPGEEEGRAFFKLFREYTLINFYTSRISLEQLSYPRLVSFHPSLPDCPHEGDPEHRRLPPPRR